MKIFIPILLLVISLPSQAIRHLENGEAPHPWNHVKQLEFKRYGDHLFGYAEVQKASNGKTFLEIRFSNGTKTKYSFGVEIRCIDPETNKIQYNYFYKREAGHTAGMGSAVEKSGEFDMSMCLESKVQFKWGIVKAELISLDDLENWGKAYLINEVFGDVAWN